VAGYDRKQGHPDPAEVLAVLGRVGLGSGSMVLDVGAGTSQFALAAARQFRRVIATEFSTFRWLFEPILAAAGFEILSAEFRGSVYGTYTCRKLRPS
jgi:hypothetical protein